VTEHHYFQNMLHQIEQAQRDNPAEARNREHRREAQRERGALLGGFRRSLTGGLRHRSRGRASTPCPDAGVPC
jgi:hypothetical protein